MKTLSYIIKPIISTIIVLLIAQQVHTLTDNTHVSPNLRYSFTNRYDIDMTNIYGTNPVSWSSQNYTLVYLKQAPSSSILALISFGKLDMNVPNGLIDLSMWVSQIERVLIKASFSSSMVNYIQKLGIRLYVAFDQFSHSPKFVAYTASSPPKRNITSSSNYTYTFTNLNQLQTTSTPKTFAYFTGFNISSTGSNIVFDLYLEVLQLNSTSVRITFYSKSATPTYLESLKFVWMSFDPAVINIPSFGQFDLYSRTLQPLSGSPSATLSGSEMWEFNTMFGVTGLSISNSSSFSFNFSFTTANTATFTADSFDEVTFLTLMVQTFYCSHITPYFLQPNSCYDSCPTRFVQNTTDLTCKQCPYDCYSCDIEGACTACSSLFDHRQLNTTSSRCVAIIGYYDDGYSNSLAQQCMHLCLSCITGSTCLTCPTNYSLNASSLCTLINSSTSGSAYENISSFSTNPQLWTQSNNSTGKTIAITISTVLFFVILLIAIVKICRFCMTKINPIGPTEAAAPLGIVANIVNIDQSRLGFDEEKRVIQQHNALYGIKEETFPIERKQPERPDKKFKGPSLWVELNKDQNYPSDKDDICSIDLQSRPLVRLSACSHYFHLKCIIQWLIKKNTCPLCQGQIQDKAFLHCQGCLFRFRLINLSNGLRTQLESTRCEDCTGV